MDQHGGPSLVHGIRFLYVDGFIPAKPQPDTAAAAPSPVGGESDSKREKEKFADPESAGARLAFWSAEGRRTHGAEAEPATCTQSGRQEVENKCTLGIEPHREAGTGGMGMENTGLWIFLITTCVVPGQTSGLERHREQQECNYVIAAKSHQPADCHCSVSVCSYSEWLLGAGSAL
ncbi:unnamed protein product [Pleuronectes platessa]|uniref:Uncharacterized protein n=1 Tax=Pleuronectes platessa TaxID=8262 RepID=A0A9N7UJ53_PLEPL|nr:unnamed protein product [Pleuronectes platessa]